MKIIDLHCDLLEFLARSFDPYNPQSHASITQLQEGHVVLQVMALFTETTEGSVERCERQQQAYTRLQSLVPAVLTLDQVTLFESLHMMPAIENASGLSEEGESLDLFFQRFINIKRTLGQPLYLSLTWNGPNRFGGGCFTNTGLTSDGKVLLEFLSSHEEARGTAIDLSHASDQLAYDILNFIAGSSYNLPLLASHSNFRGVYDHPRNLPDEFAVEIAMRGGVIGLNYIRTFLGDDISSFYRHIQYGISLGCQQALCFGGDFYDCAFFGKESFFSEYDTPQCYPHIIEALQDQHPLHQVMGIAYQNVLGYLSVEAS